MYGPGEIAGGLLALEVMSLPFVAGPGAAVAFLIAVKRKGWWQLPLFWSLVADAVFFPMIASTWGHSFPGPGFFAWKLLPFTAAAAFAILLLPIYWVWRSLDGNRRRRVWYVAGIVLIPSLQLLTKEVFPLVLEPLCGWLLSLGFYC
jgi:hypothetical protein